MMPNVTRGDRMAGLVSYLVGGGRHNEHTEPHLVAGDHALMAWYDDAELSGDNAKAIARHLDRPRTAMGVEVKGGHVWHASLSLCAEEGIRTDQEWAAKVVDDMFSPPDDYTDECMKMLDQARAALEAALGQTATSTSRALAILDAVIDTHKGDIGTHYDDCYRFHAGCLAVRVRHALGHETTEQGESK